MKEVFLPRIPPTHCFFKQSNANLSVQPEYRLHVTVSGCLHMETFSHDVAITTSQEEQKSKNIPLKKKRQVLGFDLFPQSQMSQV